MIEQETKTIFICKEPEAKEILDEIKTKGTSKERMRKAGQYCVQIYGDFFGKLNGAGMLQLDFQRIFKIFMNLCQWINIRKIMDWIMRWIMELQYLCRRL